MEWQFVALPPPPWRAFASEDEAKEYRVDFLRRQLAAADPEHAQMVKEREQAAKERDLRAQGQALAAALQSFFTEHLEGLQTIQMSTGHSAPTVGTPREAADNDGGDGPSWPL
eukprot:8813745-Pyramimonas_sp.AAC.1